MLEILLIFFGGLKERENNNKKLAKNILLASVNLAKKRAKNGLLNGKNSET
jgi:hypothetical protein